MQAEAERDRYKNEIAAISEQLRNMKVLKKYQNNSLLFGYKKSCICKLCEQN